MKPPTSLLIILAATAGSYAKVDLVTLPTRDTVQLTIYNAADMTLVREARALTVKKGDNKLQFSWENTLIDPTSLEMLPKARAGEIEIADLTYPPRVKNLGLWNVQSQMSGKVPVEISYLTSGLSWRAFYMGTLTEDEKTMRLQAYIRVTNNSGEDYEHARVRVIDGEIHVLDQIAELARRQYPYERPGQPSPADRFGRYGGEAKKELADRIDTLAELAIDAPAAGIRAKEITKEGLSEYFLFTIEGTETIPTGWSKRLLAFHVEDVPVVNLYKFDQERYGDSTVRFLSFKNDEEHKLGHFPIPGGLLKVYRTIDNANHLSYTGQSSFKYIPVDEDVELNLGASGDVAVEPTLMDFKTENFLFDRNRDIAGWDEVSTFRVEVRNTRDIPVKVEIKRTFFSQYWNLMKTGDFGQFEKEDLDTVKFTLELPARTNRQFEYTVRMYQGERRNDWREQ